MTGVSAGRAFELRSLYQMRIAPCAGNRGRELQDDALNIPDDGPLTSRTTQPFEIPDDERLQSPGRRRLFEIPDDERFSNPGRRRF